MSTDQPIELQQHLELQEKGIAWEVSNKVRESSICNLILPCFRFLHWINACPDSFEYGTGGGTVLIHYVKGSIFRKIFSFITQVLIIVHIYGFTKVVQVSAVAHVKTMYQVILMAYISFSVAGYRSTFLKCPEIVKIFHSIQQLEAEFIRMGSKLSKAHKPRNIGWILVWIYFIVAIAFTSVNRFTIGIWFEQGFNMLLRHLASSAILELNLLFDINITYNATLSSDIANGCISLPFCLLGILYDMSWVFGFLTIFLWGIIFSWIFNLFFTIIPLEDNTPLKTVQNIRKFNEITFTIDSFNDVFSPAILTAVLSGSLHFSVYVLTIFTEHQEAGLLRVMQTISFSLFWIQLFASAHVNYSAQVIGTALKRRYQTVEMKRDVITNVQLEMSVETTQGMHVIFYELLAGKIGFQGLGFFTVTYSFIGTVVSMIATYSLVVLQFKESSSSASSSSPSSSSSTP